jgi:hypothetical protein
MKTKIGEFRGRGRRRRNGEVVVEFSYSGIGDKVGSWLTAQFERPQQTLLDRFPGLGGNEPRISLIEQLKVRGYDLSTFKFSIFLKNAPELEIKKLRVPRIVSRRLCLMWGASPGDRTPDLVSTWGLPAKRRDSNMLNCWLAVYQTCDAYGPLLQYRPTQLKEELEKQGFDIRTFRFEIRHASEHLEENA